MEREQVSAKTRNLVIRAIEIVGSPKALADKCEQPRQAVDRWRRTGRVPAKHCIPIETATNGQVTRYQLRSDVFGSAPTQDV